MLANANWFSSRPIHHLHAFLRTRCLIDRANHSSVVIDTLDARGLYVSDVAGDIASPSQIPSALSATIRLPRRAQSAQGEILDDLASVPRHLLHNRNDLDAAMRQAVSAPVVSYVLGFSPQNLKLNGSFHTLKVSLSGKQNSPCRPAAASTRRRPEKPRRKPQAGNSGSGLSQEEFATLVDCRPSFRRTRPRSVSSSPSRSPGPQFRKSTAAITDD